MKKYYSQPDIPTSIICWSITGMIFLFSMLLWLEITVFQIWTLLTLLIFFFFVFIELKGRYIFIDNKFINYHALIRFNSQKIAIKDIRNISINKFGVLKIMTKFKIYEFILLPVYAKNIKKDLNIQMNKLQN